jgi:hypothetical protein
MLNTRAPMMVQVEAGVLLVIDVPPPVHGLEVSTVGAVANDRVKGAQRRSEPFTRRGLNHPLGWVGGGCSAANL